MVPAPYDSWEHRIAVLRFVQDIPLQPTDRATTSCVDTEAALPKFADVPTLISWGMKDFVFDRHFLDEWERHFPHAEVHAFARRGHYVLEDAADEVIPLVGSSWRPIPLPTERWPGSDRSTSPPPRRRWPADEPGRAGGPLAAPRRDPAGASEHVAIHLRRARRRQRRARPRAGRDRDRPRHPHRRSWSPPWLDFFALTFALFKVGAVPVLIDPGMGVRNLGRAWPRPSRRRSSASPRPTLARRVLGWGSDTIRTTVTSAGGRLLCGRHTLARLRGPASGSARLPDRRHVGRTRRPPSCSPAAAPASPRGPSTRTASSPPRSRC